MKRLVMAVGVCLTSLSAFGQGQVSMNTLGANTYLLFSNAITGRIWTNGTVYVALYWAPDAATLAAGGGTQLTNSAAGVPVGLFGSGVATNGGTGFVLGSTGGGNRFVPGRAGTTTFFQLRAWTANAGAYTYDEAVATGNPAVAVSEFSGSRATPIVAATPTSGPTDLVPQLQWNPGAMSANQAIPILLGLPEPSTMALLGAGSLFFFFLVRRRRPSQG